MLLAEVNWNGLFDKDIIFLICVALVFIVAITSAAWKSLEGKRMDTRLKEQMIASGYKADEIERVIKATASKKGDDKNKDDDD